MLLTVGSNTLHTVFKLLILYEVKLDGEGKLTEQPEILEL